MFSCLDHVLFSHLERSVKQVPIANHFARAVGAERLLIARSLNNITGPTNTRTEPGYKLNCTQQGEVGTGYRLNKFNGTIHIFPRGTGKTRNEKRRNEKWETDVQLKAFSNRSQLSLYQ